MTIVTTNPLNEQTGVDVTSKIVITFDVPVDPNTVRTSYFQLYNTISGNRVQISNVEVVSANVTLTPEALEYSSTYSLGILGGRLRNLNDPSDVLSDGHAIVFSTISNIDSTEEETYSPYVGVTTTLGPANMIDPNEGELGLSCTPADNLVNTTINGYGLINSSNPADESVNKTYFPQEIVIEFERNIDIVRSTLSDILSVTRHGVPWDLDNLAVLAENNLWNEQVYDGTADQNVLTIPFTYNPYETATPPTPPLFDGTTLVPAGYTPVWTNSEYIISLKPNKIYLEGLTIPMSYSIRLLGVLDPFYGSIESIRANLGYLNQYVDDTTIARLIHEASLYLAERYGGSVPSNYLQYAFQWVICYVLTRLIPMIANTISGEDDGIIERTQFGLTVRYSDSDPSNKLKSPYDSLDDCADLLQELDSRLTRRMYIGVKSGATIEYPGRRRGIYSRFKGFIYPNTGPKSPSIGI